MIDEIFSGSTQWVFTCSVVQSQLNKAKKNAIKSVSLMLFLELVQANTVT